VWDFQSLLKALQRQLTCVEVPWRPTPDPEARRLINELVLDEESDTLPNGQHLSHFELYRLAMADAGADTQPIDAFVSAVSRGATIEAALAEARPPAAVAPFVRATLAVALSGEAHCVAAALAWGREEVIPEMFSRLVESWAGRAPARWGRLHFYLQRHIERDGEVHRVAAHALVTRLCGDDPRRREQAAAAAREALQVRLRLWDAILSSVRAGRRVQQDVESSPAPPYAPPQ
jgi:hypothetical protein